MCCIMSNTMADWTYAYLHTVTDRSNRASKKQRTTTTEAKTLESVPSRMNPIPRRGGESVRYMPCIKIATTVHAVTIGCSYAAQCLFVLGSVGRDDAT